jgi:hypothetical protein
MADMTEFTYNRDSLLEAQRFNVKLIRDLVYGGKDQ